MKKTILSLFLLFLTGFIFAQNTVLNLKNKKIDVIQLLRK